MVRNGNVPFADSRNGVAGWFGGGCNDGFPRVVAHCGYNLKVPALVTGLAPEDAELQNIIVAGWKSFASTIDITEFVWKNRWRPDRILACAREAHYNHPEVFYLARGVKLEQILRPDGTLIKAALTGLTYSLTMPEYLVCKSKLDAAVVEAMSIISGVANEEEKALRLHDYLVNVCDCDVTVKNDTVYSTRARTAYSALVRRKAVCEGYAMAYRLLLNAAGIVSDVSIDRNDKHIWNYVKVHGRWYHVDVTWDDPVCAGPVQRRRRISRRHFLMSDRKARMTGHKCWDVRGLPPANDERYDEKYS